MMQIMKFRYLLILITIGVLWSGCADDELSPIITFDTAGKGAYVALVEVTSAVDYDLANFNSTSFDYRVEFIDIENGSTVESYDIFVGFQDNTGTNGDNSRDQVLLNSFSKGDFTVNENGKPGITVSIPLSQVGSALGLTQADMSGADFINFNTEVTTSEGAKFTASNSSAAVNGSAFRGHFKWSVKLNCPLQDSQFSGNYMMTYVSGGESPVGGAPIFGDDNQVVSVEVVTQTKRKFSIVYLPTLEIGNGAVDFVFELVCSVVLPDEGQSSGLGCGATILLGPPKAADLSNFNLADDSEFEMAFIEDVTDDCGAGQNAVTIKFTKQ